MNDKLKKLIQVDEKIKAVKEYSVLIKLKDPSHYERRKQQRAISTEMVNLCIAYGNKKRVRKAITYSLLDKNLYNTPYYKYVDTLRGLRVVLDNLTNESDELGILTVYWLDEIKKKPKKFYK